MRLEKDSFGSMEVPDRAYYGAQTARAISNFPISGESLPFSIIQSLVLIKKHGALANGALGNIPHEIARAIVSASEEVLEGEWKDQFPVDVFQTGSGTSTNMNVNEVLAHRASELISKKRGTQIVHPNDHVNFGQSSNDVIPSALHISASIALSRELLPALSRLHSVMETKAAEFYPILKTGRTHYQDATPIRLGQEFSGYAVQVDFHQQLLKGALLGLSSLALGGTAVGTGLNTTPAFVQKTIEGISLETKLPFRETKNHFAAQGSQDAVVATSACLKNLSTALIKIANDIRYLSSGPRLGIGELILPALQPGSSIMPGKVNPVMPEMLIQVAVQVIANDTAITIAGSFGHLELNTMLPLMARNLLQSLRFLSNAINAFTEKCLSGLEADKKVCEASVEKSLSMATALAPVIGYDKAAAIAKEALSSHKTIREVAVEKSGLDPATLRSLLDPERQA